MIILNMSLVNFSLSLTPSLFLYHTLFRFFVAAFTTFRLWQIARYDSSIY